ncbi:MAG: dihydroorotate dehydrogenase-like protein [Bacteroidales bacterium]|jgi:dihydroorotate dehydrogenase (fumarate)|nr:dihydroorotate dehydrogenase-like protein [Bacteroidales bacterium]
MVELSVKYLGLNLKNPVIAGSSGLTNSVNGLQRLEQSGVSAIVMKSLFEEQIYLNADYNIQEAKKNGMVYFRNSETFDYIDTTVKEEYLSNYLDTICEGKKKIQIPIIASINCVSAHEWISFASKLQDAGADALELNIALQGFNARLSSDDIEKRHLDIIHKVREKISIPLAVKISPYFADLSRFIDQLSGTGINGIVMFNRFFSPDINIDEMKVEAINTFSTPAELSNVLRWIAIKSSDVSCDLCASTGVHSGRDVIKMLLVGASAVQIVSTLYNNGLAHITTILDEIEKWMQHKGLHYIDQFSGKMNQVETDSPMSYERIQFMKYYSQLEDAENE